MIEPDAKPSFVAVPLPVHPRLPSARVADTRKDRKCNQRTGSQESRLATLVVADRNLAQRLERSRIAEPFGNDRRSRLFERQFELALAFA